MTRSGFMLLLALGLPFAAVGCDEEAATEDRVELSTLVLPVEVCRGQAFTVQLNFAESGGSVRADEIRSSVIEGSVGGEELIEEDEEGGTQSFLYSYYCDDTGPIELLYENDTFASPTFSSRAALDCRECIPNGTFGGVDGGGEIASLNVTLPNGNVASVTVQAGQITSVIYDHQANVADTVSFEGDPDVDVALTMAASGAHTIAKGSPTAQYAVYEGSGLVPFVDYLELDEVAPEPATDIAVVPDTGIGYGLAVGRSDGSTDFYWSEGSRWAPNAALSTDSEWMDGCAPGEDPLSLAIASAYMLALTGFGQICHGPLGPNANAALVEAALGLGPFDLRCPPNEMGHTPTCGILTEDELMFLAWPDESIPPTVSNQVSVCVDDTGTPNIAVPKQSQSASRTMGGVMPNARRSCFAVPCGGDTVEEVCVDSEDQTVVSAGEIEVSGCGGRHVTYANAGQVVVSCDQDFRVLSRSEFGDGGMGGTGGSGGSGGSNGNPDKPVLLHPCDVFTEADIQALTGAPMTETRLLDNENRRVCWFETSSGEGMRLDLEAQLNTASDDFFEGWKMRNNDASVIESIPWSPEGELRVVGNETTIWAYVINDDPRGRNIFLSLRGIQIGEVGDPPSLIRSVIETVGEDLNDAILAAQP